MHLRFAAGAAESTVRAYAGDIALFLTWMSPRHDLLAAAQHLASFMAWLRVTPIAGGRRSAGQPRSPQRQARIVVAVREFYKFAAAEHYVDASVLAALYQVADSRHLPAHLSVEGAGLGYVARPRHRVKLARRAHRDVCAPEEFEGMLRAARNWRDRFLLVLLWFTGLRIGQALGLCREDLHLARSSRELGCVHQGAHLHVVWRENPNGARSKSRQENVIPVDDFVLLYFERYHALRGNDPRCGREPLAVRQSHQEPRQRDDPGLRGRVVPAALRSGRDPADSSAHVPARVRLQCPLWRCTVGRGAGIARASIHPLDVDLQPHRSGRAATCDRRRPGPVERAMTCRAPMCWPAPPARSAARERRPAT